MRTTLILIFVFVAGITLSSFESGQYSSKCYKTEYKNGSHYTYKFEYYDSGSVFISKISSPYGATSKDPSPNWADKLEIVRHVGDGTSIIDRHIGSYAKTIQIDEKDDDLLIWIYFDLQGNVQYVLYCLPSKYATPVTVFEELDMELKKQAKIVLRRKSTEPIDFKLITLRGFYSLSGCKAKWEKLNKPVTNSGK